MGGSPALSQPAWAECQWSASKSGISQGLNGRGIRLCTGAALAPILHVLVWLAKFTYKMTRLYRCAWSILQSDHLRVQFKTTWNGAYDKSQSAECQVWDNEIHQSAEHPRSAHESSKACLAAHRVIYVHKTLGTTTQLRHMAHVISWLVKEIKSSQPVRPSMLIARDPPNLTFSKRCCAESWNSCYLRLPGSSSMLPRLVLPGTGTIWYCRMIGCIMILRCCHWYWHRTCPWLFFNACYCIL